MRVLKHGNINDIPYFLKTPYGNKIYNLWYGLWERGGINKKRKYLKYYKDVTVCDDWIYFSNFVKWLELQSNYSEFLENIDLRWVIDKDIKQPGNRIYSPEFCILTLASTNCKDVLTRYGNPKPKRPIIAISSSKILLFHYLSDAHSKGFYQGNIVSCCKGKIKSYKGYKWYYLNYKHGKRLRKISS